MKSPARQNVLLQKYCDICKPPQRSDRSESNNKTFIARQRLNKDQKESEPSLGNGNKNRTERTYEDTLL
jgi:hypothetical protein